MAEANEERRKFLFNASSVDIPQPEEGKKRTFKGQAYSGGRVDGHWYWGRTRVNSVGKDMGMAYKYRSIALAKHP